MKSWISSVLVGLFILAILGVGGIDSPSSLLHQELERLAGQGISYSMRGGWIELENEITRQVIRFPVLPVFESHTPEVFDGPTLLIDLTVIDTALYNWKYRFSSTVPVYGEFGLGLKSADADNNGYSEVYGIYVSELSEGTRIYEMTNDTTWIHRHTYAHPPGVIAIGVDNIDDVDKNGLLEIYGINAATLYPFEQETPSSLPITPQDPFVGISSYAIPTVLTNFQGDPTKELIYRSYRDDSTGGSINDNSIAEYNLIAGNFERIWSTQLPPGCVGQDCVHNLATGDYDLDGNQEFVTSAFGGQVYIVEYATDDSFSVLWSDSLSTAGRVTSGDVDGNGTEEFFVGGNQLEADGYIHARIVAFETSGDNSYQPFFEFNIFPVGSFFVELYQTSDIDRDGQEELLLSFGGANLIIKGNGNHKYDLFYYKSITSSRSLSAYDLNGDGVAEILMSRFYRDEDGLYSHSEIYELDASLVSVPDESHHSQHDFGLNANYPNPFNSNTQISFDIGRVGTVELSVIDLLGRTVAVLVDETKYPGQYHTSWNGRDRRTGRRVASGMYFLRLSWNEFALTRKILLIQ